jgi:hypothetical protein
LDLGATSDAGPEEDEDTLVDTGVKSKKTFMFPDWHTEKATKKLLLKLNIREKVREINFIPGIHSSIISIPKLADAGYGKS